MSFFRCFEFGETEKMDADWGEVSNSGITIYVIQVYTYIYIYFFNFMFTVISNGWSKQFIWHSSFCAMHSNPKECDMLEKTQVSTMRERALAIAWALSSYIRSGARCANHRWSVDVFRWIWDSIQHDEDLFCSVGWNMLELDQPQPIQYHPCV